MKATRGPCCDGWFWAVPFLGLLGCTDARPQAAPASTPPPAEPVLSLDASSCGTIEGRVVWQGDLPDVAPFRVTIDPLSGTPFPEPRTWANPNAPAFSRPAGGVAQAVVYLRGVDPRRAKLWDLPPVQIELRESQIHVRQGEADTRTGFVRQGQEVEVRSQDAVFHSLHAGGAAFFTLPFPLAGPPSRRPLPDKGLVELSSGAGSYWMRAYLFVDDHPYYTRTDADGRFALRQVPPGRYDVVSWLPSWQKDRHERDPEYGVIWRLSFKPPVEHTQSLELKARETKHVQFTFSAGQFPR
jgi:hypothetical protein